jgi:hypothetical protein
MEKSETGIFIPKYHNKNTIIPKILHHLWLFDNVDQQYSNMWRRTLREPWEYRLWTGNDLKEHILNDYRWSQLYNLASTDEIRYLIASFAILEKYGGVTIDPFLVPKRMIPDEFLTKKFFISFADELNTANDLSFSFMASVSSGIVNSKKRRAVESDITHPHLFEQVKNIFSIGDTNKKKYLQKLLTTDENVLIYPSYYFNPNYQLFPRKIVEMAVSVNLWKPDIEEQHQKTPLVRDYNVSQSSILARLNENPKLRLRNNVA